jgi:hypothetical protein
MALCGRNLRWILALQNGDPIQHRNVGDGSTGTGMRSGQPCNSQQFARIADRQSPSLTCVQMACPSHVAWLGVPAKGRQATFEFLKNAVVRERKTTSLTSFSPTITPTCRSRVNHEPITMRPKMQRFRVSRLHQLLSSRPGRTRPYCSSSQLVRQSLRV